MRKNSVTCLVLAALLLAAVMTTQFIFHAGMFPNLSPTLKIMLSLGFIALAMTAVRDCGVIRHGGRPIPHYFINKNVPLIVVFQNEFDGSTLVCKKNSKMETMLIQNCEEIERLPVGTVFSFVDADNRVLILQREETLVTS